MYEYIHKYASKYSWELKIDLDVSIYKMYRAHSKIWVKIILWADFAIHVGIVMREHMICTCGLLGPAVGQYN